MTGMGGFPDKLLMENARDDAFHGIMMCTALSTEEPRKQKLSKLFTEILETIEGPA